MIDLASWMATPDEEDEGVLIPDEPETSDIIGVWRSGSRLTRVDATVVARELVYVRDKMRAEGQDRIFARDVLARAAIPTSPLHVLFDWDNEVAGPKWRLQQARMLMTAIRVEFRVVEPYKYVNQIHEVPIAVSLEPTKREREADWRGQGRERGWELIDDVTRNPEKRAAYIASLVRRMHNIANDLRMFEEVAELVAASDAALRYIEGKDD